MSWTVFFNFLTALAVIPPFLKWLFVKGYRIDLRRNNFRNDANHLSKYIKKTYKKKSLKEPSELQAETNVLLADDKVSYLLVFHGLDNKLSNIFSFLKDVRYSDVFLEINYENTPIELKSRLSKKEINTFFGVSFGLHILATIFWLASYFIIPEIVFGFQRTWVVLSVVCFTAALVSFSTKAKTVDIISRKVLVKFPY